VEDNICGYCANHGGAKKGTACPVCRKISTKDDPDIHLEAPCEYCSGNHAIIFCAKYNHAMGFEPLHGYEV